MKIALLSLNYLPSTGGLVSYIFNFSKYLVSIGHEVTIICAMEKDWKGNDIEELNGIRVIRVKVFDFPIWQALFTPFHVVKRFSKALRCLIEEYQFDLYISRHIYLAKALQNQVPKSINIFICPLISPRLIYINSLRENTIRKIYSMLLIPQLYLIEKSVIRSGCPLFVLSESKRLEISKFYKVDKEDINVAPPGINDEKFNCNNIFASEKKNNTLRILSVCRIVEEKNLHLVLDAISLLISENPELVINYLIVGDGPLRGVIEKKAVDLGLSDILVIKGFVDNPEEFYKKSDIMVLPSKYEGFGHVYIEANACGIPVVGLKNGVDGSITASDEIITEPSNGYLLHENSAEEIKRVLVDFLKSNKTPEEWRRNCSLHVHKNYSWSNHFEQITKTL